MSAENDPINGYEHRGVQPISLERYNELAEYFFELDELSDPDVDHGDIVAKVCFMRSVLNPLTREPADEYCEGFLLGVEKGRDPAVIIGELVFWRLSTQCITLLGATDVAVVRLEDMHNMYTVSRTAEEWQAEGGERWEI